MKRKTTYIPPEIISVTLRDDIDDIILSGSEEQSITASGNPFGDSNEEEETWGEN